MDESYLDLTEFVAKRQSLGIEHKVAAALPPPERDSGCKTYGLPSVEDSDCQTKSRTGDQCPEAKTSSEGTHVHPATKDGKATHQEGKLETDESKAARVEVFGNSVHEVVRELRFRVYEATGLTVSAGIAANRRLAKICSDRNKPNGQYMLPIDRRLIVAFMHDLPIRKVLK